MSCMGTGNPLCAFDSYQVDGTSLKSIWNWSIYSGTKNTNNYFVLVPHSLQYFFLVFYFNGFSSNSNSCTVNDKNRRIQISSQWRKCNTYLHTLFVRDFAAMDSSSFNPHAQFLVHSALWTGGYQALESLAECQWHSPQWIIGAHSQTRTTNFTINKTSPRR